MSRPAPGTPEISQGIRELYGWTEDSPKSPANELLAPDYATAQADTRDNARPHGFGTALLEFVGSVFLCFVTILCYFALTAGIGNAPPSSIDWPEAPRLPTISLAGDRTARSLINSDNGDTFDEFVLNVASLDYEVTATFDVNGRKLTERTDFDSNSVISPAELLAYAYRHGAAMQVHNHPIMDCPFSTKDLINFGLISQFYGIDCSIVVSPDYLYTLTVPQGQGLDAKQVEQFVNNFVALYISDEEYFQLLGRDEETAYYASQDAFIELFADTFGLTFTKEPLWE